MKLNLTANLERANHWVSLLLLRSWSTPILLIITIIYINTLLYYILDNLDIASICACLYRRVNLGLFKKNEVDSSKLTGWKNEHFCLWRHLSLHRAKQRWRIFQRLSIEGFDSSPFYNFSSQSRCCWHGRRGSCAWLFRRRRSGARGENKTAQNKIAFKNGLFFEKLLVFSCKKCKHFFVPYGC